MKAQVGDSWSAGVQCGLFQAGHSSFAPTLKAEEVLALPDAASASFPADPLVGSIATQYMTNRAEHDRMARQWTKRYAT